MLQYPRSTHCKCCRNRIAFFQQPRQSVPSARCINALPTLGSLDVLCKDPATMRDMFAAIAP
jgi:hypothetical protein